MFNTNLLEKFPREEELIVEHVQVKKKRNFFILEKYYFKIYLDY